MNFQKKGKIFFITSRAGPSEWVGPFRFVYRDLPVCSRFPLQPKLDKYIEDLFLSHFPTKTIYFSSTTPRVVVERKRVPLVSAEIRPPLAERVHRPDIYNLKMSPSLGLRDRNPDMFDNTVLRRKSLSLILQSCHSGQLDLPNRKEPGISHDN